MSFFSFGARLAKSHYASTVILLTASDGSPMKTSYFHSLSANFNTRRVLIASSTPDPLTPSQLLARKVNAATAIASVPVVNVGWTTGAKNGLWLTGCSFSVPFLSLSSHSACATPPKIQ
jgi:hypothetical protein